MTTVIQPASQHPSDEVDAPLVAAIRAALAAAADPVKAPAMQAYMKSAMPFRGVPRPMQRAAVRPLLATHPPESSEALWATARDLFGHAEYREERYAAIDYLGHRHARAFRTPALMPLLEELAVAGAWWDIVDAIGSLVADLHRRYPTHLKPRLLELARVDDLWLRRLAVISQLGSKSATDTDLLRRVIEPNVRDRDFFIRKAIGWALREYARTDPGWVTDFVAQRADTLSPLSIREATKHL